MKMDPEGCIDGKGAWVLFNKGQDPHSTLSCKGY